jgi:hypothetical protein
MLDAESLIWSKFLSVLTYPQATVAYDVHVGTEPILPPDTAPEMVIMANALFTKRIDAILFLPSMTLVCEVKPYASSSAIGQALSYCLLFRRDYPQFPHAAPAIVTDKPHPDTAFICEHFFITLFQVNEL